MPLREPPSTLRDRAVAAAVADRVAGGQVETGGNVGCCGVAAGEGTGESPVVGDPLCLCYLSRAYRAGAPSCSKWSISETCFAAWASWKLIPLQCRQVG